MAERVIAGSDHAGLVLRGEAVKVARDKGFEVEDLGPFSGDSVDYPDYAKAVAEAVAAEDEPVGHGPSEAGRPARLPRRAG